MTTNPIRLAATLGGDEVLRLLRRLGHPNASGLTIRAAITAGILPQPATMPDGEHRFGSHHVQAILRFFDRFGPDRPRRSAAKPGRRR